MSAGLGERMARLETIVRALDSDAVELDEALALFEEGVGHLQAAREILAAAELKVEELIADGEGESRPPRPAGEDGPDGDGDG